LDRLRITFFGALIVGVLSTQSARAQTAANITVLSGNGQVTCQTCNPQDPNFFRFFKQMAVKVTDAAGTPIPNKTVNWTLTSSQGPLPFFASQTATDGNGVTFNFVTQPSQSGSFAQEYLQSVIQASADAATANFYLTQGLSATSTNQASLQFVNAKVISPDPGTSLQGTAGGTSTTAIRVRVDAFGIPIPNASVRVLNGGDPATTASVSCATGAGADIGSVLTDTSGNATCNLIFGPIAGSSSFTVLVGGIDPAATSPDIAGTTTPVAYFQSGAFPFTVQAGVAGMLSVSSGNNQSVNPGQQTSPLVVKVSDASGQNTIAGASVVWSATPAGAVTFNPATSTSGAGGLAQTVATLSSTAAGAITIKANLTGSLSNISTTFTVTSNVVLSGLQKVSGDQQSSPAGQAFTQPLVVQVNGTTGQPIASYPVNFTITGPGTLSGSTASTNSAGRAQVTVTAGATQGAVTVTATAGSFTQSFSLSVIPPGPSLAASSFYNGADFQPGALSPCSIATIIAPGIASTVSGVVTPGTIIGPLPYTLANVKVSFANSQAPVFNVANQNGQQQVTVQVPCDVTPGASVAVNVSVSGGNGTANIPILPASPGVFLTQSSDGRPRIVAVRPDGSFVSLENPARRGEVIRAYVTGLGAVAPSIATNSIPVPGTDSMVLGQVIVGINNSGVRLISARLAPNLIGVYEVVFQVPSDAPAGNDVVFSVGINALSDTQTRYSAGTSIPIL